MATVVDIQDGGELHLSYSAQTARRIAFVQDLSGSDADAMLYDAYLALVALTASIDFGVAHPSIPSLVVTGIDIYPGKACATARCEITYGLPQYVIPANPANDGDATKTVRSFGVPREYTTEPLDPGEDLVVSAPPQYSGRPDQIKTITVNESHQVIVFERSEPAIPTLRQRTYQNKINSVALGTGGLYPIGSVYCDVIDAVRTGTGRAQVRYEFTWVEGGYDVEFKWERPPLDVSAYDSGSRKTIPPYDEVDFTALGFDWDD